MPDTISIPDFCRAIYCALTTWNRLEIDSTGAINLTATVTDAGRITSLQVAFEGVTNVTRRSDRPGNEPNGIDQLEFSVVELEGEPGKWRFWSNPYYVHEIEFDCVEIRLNGNQVVGAGRWLQDELPGWRPALRPK
jgi:hypothetical protein